MNDGMDNTELDTERLALDTAIDDIVFACTNLCEVLEIENDALRRHDTATVGELLDTKKALGDLYERAMAPLLDDPDLFERVEPDTRASLMALGERLQELVHQNAILLQSGMEATRRVMDIVVEAAKQQATRTGNYGRAGTREAAAGTNSSLSFNKHL